VTSISSVSAVLGTHIGAVESGWNRTKHNAESISMTNTIMLWHRVGIPVGAVAEVHVLIYDWGEQSVTVLESGSTVWANGKFQPGQTGVTSGVAGQGEIIFSVGSGIYEFEVMISEF
jgi:hypothetical protein